MCRKSQVNVDLLVSYIIFIVFIGFLINFSVKLTEPFSNVLTMEKEDLEMSMLYKKMPGSVDVASIGEICDINQENLQSARFNYEIIGFEMPEYDSISFQTNKTEGGMLIIRNGRDITVYASSNDGAREYLLILQFPESTNALANNTSIEGNDTVSTITDNFGGKLVSITLHVNNTDSDEVGIYTEDSGFVTIQQFSGGELRIGETYANGGCGGETGNNERALSGYITIIDRQKSFLAKYSLMGEWLN